MIIGITGTVGAGKSTVARMFEKRGASRVDADRLAHEAIGKGKTPYRGVVRLFGREILKKNFAIDRKKLARRVFGDPRKLKQLNRLIHPYVLRRIREETKRALKRNKGAWIIVEVPLLHEAGLERMFDKVITVSCKSAVQKGRWRERGGSIAELEKRCASQLPLSYKARHSDYVVDNSGKKRETNAQVGRIWEHLNHSQGKAKT